MPKVIQKKGLTPLVQGGDTSFSHKIKEKVNKTLLVPRIKQNQVKAGIFVLILVLIFGIILSVISGKIGDAIILALVIGTLIVFIKKGKNAARTEIDTEKRKLTMHNEQEVTTIAFDDIEHVEIICKLKYAGNDLVTKTNELNIACHNGKRFNLATGGDDKVVTKQANRIAEIMDINIHKDEKQKYR